jgi:hypothetical protein
MSKVPNELLNNLDLDDYEDIDQAILELVNPETKEKTTSTITLASKEHPNRKKLDLTRTRRLRAEYNKKGKLPITDPLDEIDEETDYLVTSTLGWNLLQKGKPLEFSEANARALYTNPKLQWVRAQVMDALNENAIFIKASAKA